MSKYILFLLIFIGFTYSRGHFTLGVNYSQKVDASFSNWGEWDDIYYDFLPNAPSHYYTIREYKLINDVLLGYYYYGLLGKSNKIDLYCELMYSFDKKSKLLDYSQFDYGMNWRFLNFKKIDFFLKVGLSEILNFKINNNIPPAMSRNTNSTDYGIGILYNEKIRLSYDVINLNISKKTQFSQILPIDGIGYQYSLDISRFNITYMF